MGVRFPLDMLELGVEHRVHRVDLSLFLLEALCQYLHCKILIIKSGYGFCPIHAVPRLEAGGLIGFGSPKN